MAFRLYVSSCNFLHNRKSISEVDGKYLEIILNFQRGFNATEKQTMPEKFFVDACLLPTKSDSMYIFITAGGNANVQLLDYT